MTFFLPSSEARKQSANQSIDTAKGRLHGGELERKQHLRMPTLQRHARPLYTWFLIKSA